jgi:hypothetical protein
MQLICPNSNICHVSGKGEDSGMNNHLVLSKSLKAAAPAKSSQKIRRSYLALKTEARGMLYTSLACTLLTMCGCGKQHFTIAAPKAPVIDPSTYYSQKDFTEDVGRYTTAVSPGATNDPGHAKQARNDIAYGLMGQIEVVYGAYYNHLFVFQSSVAIGSDALTLGLSAASSIATHAATKTLFSALGTGISGIGLSTQKNLFSQQAFPIIGLAMETRRDGLRTQIILNLANDVTTYPLNAVKRDLIAYLNAGTLPGGLQEIQAEAGAASAAQAAKTNASQPAPAPTGLTAGPGPGDHQISLGWTATAGATSYNVYFSTTPGVTVASAKLCGCATNSYIHSGIPDGKPYYYVVTAVTGSSESATSAQASATPGTPPVATDPPSLNPAVAEVSSVMLSWSVPIGSTQFNIYYSQTSPLTKANRTQVIPQPGSTITTPPYTVTGLTPQTQLYFVVTAINGGVESAPSNTVSATPLPAAPVSHSLIITAH